MDLDENTRLPWSVDQPSLAPPPPVVDLLDPRVVARWHHIDHVRQHPISDSGVKLHSIMGGPAPNWEPNRPAAAFSQDLVDDRGAKQNYWFVPFFVGACFLGIVGMIVWCLAVFG